MKMSQSAWDTIIPRIGGTIPQNSPATVKTVHFDESRVKEFFKTQVFQWHNKNCRLAFVTVLSCNAITMRINSRKGIVWWTGCCRENVTKLSMNDIWINCRARMLNGRRVPSHSPPLENQRTIRAPTNEWQTLINGEFMHLLSWTRTVAFKTREEDSANRLRFIRAT